MMEFNRTRGWLANQLNRFAELVQALRKRAKRQPWLVTAYAVMVLGLAGVAASMPFWLPSGLDLAPIPLALMLVLPTLIVTRDLVFSWPEGNEPPWPLWFIAAVPVLALTGAAALVLTGLELFDW